MWPEYWEVEQLLGVKASVALPKWNAQYMQNPTSEEGALIKSDWWKVWPEDRGIPRCCLLYTSPSPRDRTRSRMPSSA